MCEDIKKESATDTLIRAMESAEEMEDVIVLHRKKGDTGFGWTSNVHGTTAKIGILELVKMGIYQHGFIKD